MKEKLKVPKLRFKEFSGEWEENTFDKFVTIKGGYAFDSNKMLNAPSKYQILKMSNVYKSKLLLDRSPSYIEEINEKEKDYILQYGDTIITLTGTVGKKDYGYSIIITENDKYLLNQRLAKISSINDKSDNFFVNQYISINKFLDKFYVISRGGTGNQTNVSTKDMENIEVVFPSLPEQQKIADFLSKVDEKIEKLTKKKELLEQYKKGVMQKIFSQELRFKDDNGNDFPEWEEKELGEVLIKNSIKNKNQEFQLVQSVSNKYGFVNQDEYFEDRTVASKDLSNYYVIKKGMFAYNPSRIDVGSLAYKYDNEISVISPLYISFEANNSFIADNYLLNWFGTIQFKNQMNRSFEGSVRNTLSYEALRKILIGFPSLPEQQKIADFLSTLDKKIDIVDKELGQVQEFKKGLLQQMFV